LQKRLKTYENFSKIQKNIKQQLKKKSTHSKRNLKKNAKRTGTNGTNPTITNKN
jgi:hypothetical protein